MRHLLTPLLFLSFLASGQDSPEPSVVFLFPYEVAIAETLRTDLQAYDKEIAITDQIRKNFIPENLAPNWKTVREKELDFVCKQDFTTVLVIALSRELTYREVVQHENLLIYPVKESSKPDKASYKTLADGYGVSWLVNVQKVKLLHEGPKKSLEVSLQFYNVMADRIFLNKTYTVDSEATGFCEGDIWRCLSEEIKKGIANDLAHILDMNRHYHRSAG